MRDCGAVESCSQSGLCVEGSAKQGHYDQLCACNAGHRHTHIYPTHREPHFFKEAVKLKEVMQRRSDCQNSLDIYLP